MDIEIIQTFLKVVENNSFTQTAEELFCSQAAVSLRIKNLEKYLDTTLFKRDNKKFILTNDGKTFIPYATKIVDTLRDAQKEMFASNNLRGQCINIASSSTPGTYIFPRIIYEFKKKYPNTTLINQVEYTKDVMKDIEDHKFAIGFISQPYPPELENIHAEAIMDDPLTIFVSINHPWSQREEIQLEDLTNETLLISNPKASIVRYLEKFTNTKFPTSNIHVMGNIEAIKNGVTASMGFSVLSRFSIEKELQYGLIKEVKLANSLKLSRKIYCIKNKSVTLSLSDEIFLDYVRKQCK